MRSALNYNIHEGNLEAMVHGYKNGFVKPEEYNNLAQCDSLGDLKSQLQVTDYGNFLQNDGVLTSRIISERATEKLCAEFHEIRGWCDATLGKFLDFLSYDYMISNVLKLIAGARHQRDSLDVLYKCHPLGLFDGIAALTATTSIEDMYETVLIDSPIGQFFMAGVQPRDLDELSIEYVRGVLQKNYLEAFYDFVLSLGGETATVMGTALAFEADRLVISVAANTAGMKDLMPEDRKKLFPNFGTLVDVHEELCSVTSSEQVAERLKFAFPEFADLFEDSRGMEGGSSKKSIEKKLSQRAVEIYKDCMAVQFQYGVFFGWVKLKEVEVSNLMWIAECITQNVKHRVHEYAAI